MGLRLWDDSKVSSKGILTVPEGRIHKDSLPPKVGSRLWDDSEGSSKGILKVPEGFGVLPFQAGQKVCPPKKKEKLLKIIKSLYL